jgi:ABC-2 type transport system ATP-binding protein
MREMCQQGMAIFFSTHVLEVAEKLCNKVAIIKDGKLIISGKTEEVVGNESLENVFLDSVDSSAVSYQTVKADDSEGEE